MTTYASIESVDTRPLGSTTTVPAAAGDTTLVVGDVIDFDAAGGSLRIGESVLTYSTADPGIEDGEDSTIELSTELPGDVDEETLILVEPYGEQRIALLALDDEGDALEVTVPHALSAVLTDGVRDPDDRETVSIEETEPGVWVMVDVLNRRAELTADAAAPLASDGEPPAASPTPTVIGGIGALYARWEAVENHDPVTYDVHVSTVPDFDPVSPDDITEGDPVIEDELDSLSGWAASRANPDLPEPVEVPTVENGRALIPGGYRIKHTDPFDLTERSAKLQIDAGNLAAAFDSPTRVKTGQQATALVVRLYSTDVQLVSSFLLDDLSVVSNVDGVDANYQYGTWTTDMTHVRFRHNHAGTRILLQSSFDGLTWISLAEWGSDQIDVTAVSVSIGVRNFDTDADRVQEPYVALDYFELAPNTNGVSTLAANTASTSTTIRQLPDGSDLAYDTDYYVRLVARDVDGRAEPSDQGTDQLVRVNSPDIAAEYVYAGNVLADQITGGSIQSDILMSGAIRTANSGARVEMTAFGLVVYRADGTPTTQLGSDGTSTFKGQVQASTLTVTDGMSIRGGLNEVGKAGVIQLSAATQNSPNAPTVVCDYPRTQLLEAGKPYAAHQFKSIQKVGSDYWVAMRDADKDTWAVRKFLPDGTYFGYIGFYDNLGLGQFATVSEAGWGLATRDESNLMVQRVPFSTTPQISDPMDSLTNWDTSGNVTSSGGSAVLSQIGEGSASITSKNTYNLRSRSLLMTVTVPPLAANQTYTVQVAYDATHRIYAEFAMDTADSSKLRCALRTVSGTTVKSTLVADKLAQNLSTYLYIDVHGGYAQAILSGMAKSSAKVAHTLTAAQLQAMKLSATLANTADTNTGNLIGNSGFEQGLGGYDTWFSDMAFSLATNTAHTGSQSAAIRSTNTGGGDVAMGIKDASKKAVTPGQRISMSYWIKANAQASTVGVQACVIFRSFDKNGALIQTSSAYTPAEGETVTTDWQKKTFTATVPTGNYFVAPSAYLFAAPSSSAIYYLDDFYIGPSTEPITAKVGDVKVDWVNAGIDLGTRKNKTQPPAIGVTESGNYMVAEYDASANQISVRYFDAEAPDVESSTELLITPPAGFTGPVASVDRGTMDFGATRTVIKELGARDFLVYSGANLVASSQFPADGGGSVGSTWSPSDGGFIALGSNGYLYKHTGPTNGLTTATGPWSTAFTWYDGKTAGGVHETSPSPRAPFTMQKRSRITVTSPDIPNLGGNDDPDRIKVYMAQSASGTLYLQGTTAEGVQSFQTGVVVFTGTTPPISSNFPGEAPATIRNQAGTLSVSGDGTMKAANLTVTNTLTAPTLSTPTVTATTKVTTPLVEAGNVTVSGKLTRTVAMCRGEIYTTDYALGPTSGSYKYVNAYTEAFDTTGIFNPTTGTITIAEAGIYIIGASMLFSSNADGRRFIQLEKNGTVGTGGTGTVLTRQELVSGSGAYVGPNISTMVQLASGDTVALTAYWTAAATVVAKPQFAPITLTAFKVE